MSSGEQSTLDCHAQLLVPTQNAPASAARELTKAARVPILAAPVAGEGRTTFELADVRLTQTLDEGGVLRVRFAHTSTARLLLGIDKNECTYWVYIYEYVRVNYL